MKPSASSAINEPQGNGSNRFAFPDFQNTQWFIVSENNSSDIKESIIQVLRV